MQLPNLKNLIINTAVRRIVYIVIGLIITSLFGHCAHAETVPANQAWDTIDHHPQSSADAACSYMYTNFYNYLGTPAPNDYTNPTLVNCRVTNSGGATSTFAQTGLAYSCPSGATLSGSTCTYSTSCAAIETRQPDGSCAPKTCPSGQTLQYDGTCHDGCIDKKGTRYTAGSYPMAHEDGSDFNNVACQNGCTVTFSGSAPGATSLDNGHTAFYAVGSYDFTGGICDGGDTGVTANPTGNIAPPSCGAGQSLGTVNGKNVCYNNGTGKIDNPNTPKTTGSTTQSPTVTNPDGSKTSSQTSTDGNGKKTTVTTIENTDGSKTITTQVTDSPTATTDKNGEETKSTNICDANPDIPACKDAAAGEAHTTEGVYTADPSRKTFDTVVSGFTSSVQSAPFYSASTAFFVQSIPTGSCGGMSGSFDVFGQSFNVNMDSVFCSSAAQTMYSYLSIGLKLVATWLAFSIAFL